MILVCVCVCVYLFAAVQHETHVRLLRSAAKQGGSLYSYVQYSMFKKNLNASKPSEHPPQVEECLKVYQVGGNIGCRDKTSSWYQKGSPM